MSEGKRCAGGVGAAVPPALVLAAGLEAVRISAKTRADRYIPGVSNVDPRSGDDA